MFHGQGKEKSCPLNSVVKPISSYVKDILCIGVMLVTFNRRKKKANDIPTACEFRDVFLKSYRDSFAKRN